MGSEFAGTHSRRHLPVTDETKEKHNKTVSVDRRLSK